MTRFSHQVWGLHFGIGTLFEKKTKIAKEEEEEKETEFMINWDQKLIPPPSLPRNDTHNWLVYMCECRFLGLFLLPPSK
jgi:hypothetical protein